jgi:hypothetical protein
VRDARNAAGAIDRYLAIGRSPGVPVHGT